MPVRPAASPVTDVVRLAVEVLAAQGLGPAAARAALTAMAQERSLPVTRCAEFVVAAVDRPVG
jgi:hypothetical protein